MDPLRERFQVIDRLARFNLDDALHAAPTLSRVQHQVRVNLKRSSLDGRVPLLADVGHDVVLALELGLEVADDPVVLELLPDWSDEDRHAASGCEITADSTTDYARLTIGDFLSIMDEPTVIQIDTPESTKTGKSILIVDDDRSALDTLARLLKLEGFSVATAADAETGITLAEQMRPNAIILDLRMPVVNGIQMLRRLRSHPDLVDVPVGMVTGDYFMPEATAAEIKSLGASLRFKPMWLEDLLALARTLVAV
jgi:CheY-like chemotaxis protein